MSIKPVLDHSHIWSCTVNDRVCVVCHAVQSRVQDPYDPLGEGTFYFDQYSWVVDDAIWDAEREDIAAEERTNMLRYTKDYITEILENRGEV